MFWKKARRIKELEMENFKLKDEIFELKLQKEVSKLKK